jgi:hypothetical protein
VPAVFVLFKKSSPGCAFDWFGNPLYLVTRQDAAPALSGGQVSILEPLVDAPDRKALRASKRMKNDRCLPALLLVMKGTSGYEFLPLAKRSAMPPTRAAPPTMGGNGMVLCSSFVA